MSPHPSPIQEFHRDDLEVKIFADDDALGAHVAAEAASVLENALKERGEARVILATANSQKKFLEALVAGQGTSWNLDWSRITLFHMDEYLGLPDTHPASFRYTMQRDVEQKLQPKQFHYLEGDADLPLDVIDTYEALLKEAPIDLCCLGIGENGHLAFNDPHVANFEDTRLVKIVKLDEPCRLQQVGEGHFKDLDAVPQYAMTLTIPMLCRAKRMLAIVPESRKAKAVQQSLEGPIQESCPGSFLRKQAHCTLYLDSESASLLSSRS